MSHQEILEAGPDHSGITALIGYEEVGRKSHQLPEDEEEEPVGYAYDPHHPGYEYLQQRVESARALVFVEAHISD